MQYTLRLAVPKDIPVLEELIGHSVRTLQTGDYTEAQIEGAIGAVFGVDSQLIEDGTYYVAESGLAIVGCGGWSRRKTLFGGDRGKSGADTLLQPGKDPARIRAFFIHPEWARRGIGSAILSACEEAVVQAGFTRIDIVATLTGENLYAKFNYKVIEHFLIPLQNGASMSVVRMTKWMVPSSGAGEGGPGAQGAVRGRIP